MTKSPIYMIAFMLVYFSLNCNQSTQKSKTPIRFQRVSSSPFIPQETNTFYSKLVANPAVTEFKQTLFLFFRGQSESGHDQIGMWTTPTKNADGLHWLYHHPVPIIPVSPESSAPDDLHILDPAAIAKADSLFLYYTGKSSTSEPGHSVCLAISTDGINFKKYVKNPVIKGGIAPEVILHDNLYHLFYQKKESGERWGIYLATSSTGIEFDTAKNVRVFGPSGKPGTFDEHSVATGRIFREGEYYYMTYGGCAHYLDYPENIGLARSIDLIHWERYTDNPVFIRGEQGSWDEGALWFPTVRKFGGRYMMWYEGAGTGMGMETDSARKESNKARQEEYGGYLKTSFSQIGAAIYEGSFQEAWK